MDPITSQPPEPLLPPQHKHFLNKKFLITLVVLLLLGGGAYAGIWYWGNQQVSLVQPDSLAATYYPSYSNYPAFVQLTWDYPVADYFNIYRSVDQKNWQKISSNFPQSAHAAIDRELPTGVGTLYYQITSSDGRGNESEPSQIASVSLTSSVDISTWKTYTNGQYGFSLRRLL